jgi:hypothetical protein
MSSTPGDERLGAGKTSDSALVAVGQGVCSELRGHVSVPAVFKGLKQSGWDVGPAGAIVAMATDLRYGLCPDLHGAVLAWMTAGKSG